MPKRTLLAEMSWRTLRACLRGADRVYVSGRRQPSEPRSFEPFLLPAALPPVASLPESARALCIVEAENALEGRFDILGYGLVDFDAPPRWHADPQRGYEWPLDKSAKIGALPGRADIKVPWEASRMHWLVALARAGHYTGDERYLKGADELLRHWQASNPVGLGPNWVTSMEVGIRVVNLVWAAEVFRDPTFNALVGGLIFDHAWHLLRNLEYTPALTSNHYLGNIAGVCYAGAAFRNTRTGRLWLRSATGALNREIKKQFLADGANFEASTGYHRVSTELCLLSVVAAHRAGQRVDSEALDRLGQALLALSVMAGPCELMPAVGDDDSGLAVGLVTRRHPRDGRVLSASGLAVLGLGEPGHLDPGDFSAGTPEPDEFAYWLLGRYVIRPPSVNQGSLPLGGIYTFSDSGLWCLADCGGVGQRGNGGHAHNDTLSFVVAVAGTLFVIDPGSGNYTGDPNIRNTLRSVSAHSTVCVDNSEINRFDPELLFTMRDEDEPAVQQVQSTPGRWILSASHRGYTRLPDPVVHRRRWNLQEGGLTIKDTLECRGRHTAQVSLPLAPGADAAMSEAFIDVRLQGTTLRIAQTDGPALTWTLEMQPYADRYGQTVESPVLRSSILVNGSTSWSLRLCPVDR